MQAHVAQGDADFSGIQFAITTINTNPVRVNGTDYANGQVVYTMTTNAAGDATTTADLLPYGQYQIKEVATNGSYLLTNGNPQTFWIDTDGAIVSANTEGNAIHFDDEIHKGQGQIIKFDDDLAEAIAQGDASFAGIRYAIVNQSTKDVKVGGTVYAPGQVVMVVTLNTDGIATTGERTLPYGTYGVYELRVDATIAAGDVYAGSDKLGTSIYANNNGYLFKEQSSDRLEIREDGETKSARFSDKVVTGYAKVTKKDVTVKVEDAPDVVYDSEPHTGETEYTFTGIVSGQTATITYTPAQGTNVATYTGSFGDDFKVMAGSREVTDNYDLKTKTPGKLTITKAQMSVEASTYNKPYDGAAHAGSGTPSVTEGTSLQYRYRNGDTWTDWSEEAPSITDVGTITYRVRATNANYEDATAAGTLTVNKATMTVTAEGFSGTYDGTAHGITVTAPEGATVKYGTAEGTYDLTASPTYTDAGTYTVYYQVTADNYTTYTGSAKVTVSAKQTQTITVSS